MNHKTTGALNRREFGEQALAVGAALAVAQSAAGQEERAKGVISGEPTAEKVGQRVLAEGGNAVDAIVAAAFVAAVVVPHQTGIGGYGGHMTVAMNPQPAKAGGGAAVKADPGQVVACIDFNSMASAAAREDMFAFDANGKVVGQKNLHGWLAAGVPGIPAGLDLAARRFGTFPLKTLLEPAIGLAEDGFPLGPAAAPLRSASMQLAADPGSLALYFRDGKPLEAKDHYQNRDVARMLRGLAADGSVESFYRGEVAERIAAAFAANGGQVTKEDLAAYQARETRPQSALWGEWTIHTAPLTAGGTTTLHAMLLLKELGWAERDPASADTLQLQVEAYRQAWQDRLELFGDPSQVAVPLDRLFDAAEMRKAAGQIEQAVAKRQPLPVRVTSRPDQGTIHLSAADAQGNFAAVTLTHGGAFGARVTVPGLGLTLGHGVSRFEPRAGHPNSPGPHKRPLNNMCPTVVMKGGRAVAAVGGRGGRKIPNAVGDVLLQLVARQRQLADAIAQPRLHTEGTLAISLERMWPAELAEEMKRRGYQVATANSATVSAVARDGSGLLVAAMR